MPCLASHWELAEIYRIVTILALNKMLIFAFLYMINFYSRNCAKLSLELKHKSSPPIDLMIFSDF